MAGLDFSLPIPCLGEEMILFVGLFAVLLA